MYTVLWTDTEGRDHWERLESREEVNDLLDREGIRDADTLIFTPEADDYAECGDTFGE